MEPGDLCRFWTIKSRTKMLAYTSCKDLLERLPWNLVSETSIQPFLQHESLSAFRLPQHLNATATFIHSPYNARAHGIAIV